MAVNHSPFFTSLPAFEQRGFFYFEGTQLAEPKTSITDEWGFFTPIPDDFINESKPLSDQARWLFILLRFHTNKKTKKAFPSYQQIHDETGWAKPTIAKAIRQLEAGGWLTREKQFGGNNHYTLKRPQPFTTETIDESSNSSPRKLLEFTTETSIVHNENYSHDKERARQKKEIPKKELPKKEREDQSPTPQPRPSPVIAALSALLLSLHGISDKSGWQLQSQFQSIAIQLEGIGATVEQFQAFWDYRTSKPGLKFIVGDFTTWRVNIGSQKGNNNAIKNNTGNRGFTSAAERSTQRLAERDYDAIAELAASLPTY